MFYKFLILCFGFFFLLGVIWDGKGINFVLYFENVIGVELCFFDVEGYEIWFLLIEQIVFVWYGYLLGI